MALLWSERQKERGIKLNLTWFAARNCWKKKVDSKNPVYLKHPNSADGYQAALLDLAQRINDKANETPDWARKTEFGEIVQTVFGYPESPMETIVRTMRDNNLDDKVLEVITGNVAQQHHTWAAQVALFLKLKQAQATGGSRSTGTWGNLKGDLKYAESYLGAMFSLKDLTKKKITDFYLHLGEVKGKGAKLLKEGRKHNVYRSFCQFIRWYWRQDDTELPASAFKALNDPDLTFSDTVVHVSSSLFTPEEIQQSLKISPRWRAWILLSLNCGFTQIDISSLTVEQLNGNRLTHKRAKTRKMKNPPTICYKLWPETVEAIKNSQPNATGRVWTTKNGGPMVVDGIIEKDGEKERKKYDNIGNRWAKLQQTVGKKAPNKSLKYLRKTGRTTLRKNGFGEVSSMYLGHAPQTMGEKSYDAIDGEPFEPLDKATDKLRKLLGIG